MASYKCPRCGEKYDSGISECPVCGFETGAYTVETFFGHQPENKQTKEHKRGARHTSHALPVVCALLLAVAVVFGVFYFSYFKPLDKYNYGVARMVAGDYEGAAEIFNGLAAFKDSHELALQCEEKVAVQEEEKARLAELESEYNEACQLLDAGDPQAAKEAFASLGDFSDSSARVQECEKKISENTYYRALELMNAGRMDEALLTFGEAKGYADADKHCQNLSEILEKSDEVATLEVGDCYTFGSLELDGNASNGSEGIEWYVLNNDGESVTLLSRYILFERPFNSVAGETDWAGCSLRKYLNSDFIAEVFDETEEPLLAEVTSATGTNPRFAQVNQGAESIDSVRLLSLQEYEEIYALNPELLTAEVFSGETWNYSMNWWLRTMGASRMNAAFINVVGASDAGGSAVENGYYGVRPVITLKIF